MKFLKWTGIIIAVATGATVVLAVALYLALWLFVYTL